MESMIEFIHERIGKKHYDQGIDFTMGNGHDTLFLSDYCKHVYSYDIQALALNNTKELIKDKKNVTLFLKSHEYFDEDLINLMWVFLILVIYQEVIMNVSHIIKQL